MGGEKDVEDLQEHDETVHLAGPEQLLDQLRDPVPDRVFKADPPLRKLGKIVQALQLRHRQEFFPEALPFKKDRQHVRVRTGRGVVVAFVVPENMREVGSHQEYVTRFEGADVVAGDNLSFTLQHQGKLYLWMLVEIIVKVMFAIFL